jgi:hypothetical protein
MLVCAVKVIVHTLARHGETFSASPFCGKVAMFCLLSDIPYEFVKADFRRVRCPAV